MKKGLTCWSDSDSIAWTTDCSVPWLLVWFRFHVNFNRTRNDGSLTVNPASIFGSNVNLEPFVMSWSTRRPVFTTLKWSVNGLWDLSYLFRVWQAALLNRQKIVLTFLYVSESDDRVIAAVFWQPANATRRLCHFWVISTQRLSPLLPLLRPWWSHPYFSCRFFFVSLFLSFFISQDDLSLKMGVVCVCSTRFSRLEQRNVKHKPCSPLSLCV